MVHPLCCGCSELLELFLWMMAGLCVGCVCNEACKIANQDKVYIPLLKSGRVVWSGVVGYASGLRDVARLAMLCAV